jgi:riboflavin kinase/FMN adenylyltransferase
LQIIEQLVSEAKAINGTAVLITFYPHPKQVVGLSNNPLFIINTLQEKSSLLENAGIEHLVVVPFSKEFADQPAAEYISNFLVKCFRPHTIIIGYDHRFGKNREGDYHLLEKQAGDFGYVVKEIPEKILRNATISSTKIREALIMGDIATANNFLGYHYFFSGIVIEGNKLGRTIGYPTANLFIEDENKLVPSNGVYAVEVVIENKSGKYKGMMNIGIRPTVGGTKRVVEVNIFDFDEMIYDKKVTVYLTDKFREEAKFNGLEELKNQLAQDKIEALKILGTI